MITWHSSSLKLTVHNTRLWLPHGMMHIHNNVKKNDKNCLPPYASFSFWEHDSLTAEANQAVTSNHTNRAVVTPLRYGEGSKARGRPIKPLSRIVFYNARMWGKKEDADIQTRLEPLSPSLLKASQSSHRRVDENGTCAQKSFKLEDRSPTTLLLLLIRTQRTCSLYYITGPHLSYARVDGFEGFLSLPLKKESSFFEVEELR